MQYIYFHLNSSFPLSLLSQWKCWLLSSLRQILPSIPYISIHPHLLRGNTSSIIPFHPLISFTSSIFASGLRIWLTQKEALLIIYTKSPTLHWGVTSQEVVHYQMFAYSATCSFDRFIELLAIFWLSNNPKSLCQFFPRMLLSFDSPQDTYPQSNIYVNQKWD